MWSSFWSTSAIRLRHEQLPFFDSMRRRKEKKKEKWNDRRQFLMVCRYRRCAYAVDRTAKAKLHWMSHHNDDEWCRESMPMLGHFTYNLIDYIEHDATHTHEPKHANTIPRVAHKIQRCAHTVQYEIWSCALGQQSSCCVARPTTSRPNQLTFTREEKRLEFSLSFITRTCSEADGWPIIRPNQRRSRLFLQTIWLGRDQLFYLHICIKSYRIAGTAS